MSASKPRIKVCIVINDFLVGGAQKILAQLLAHIDRTQFEPCLVTLFDFGGLDEDYFYDLISADVPVYRLRFTSIWDIGQWWRLYELFKTIDPQVVLSNLFFSNTITRILKPFFHYNISIVEHNTYSEKSKLHQLIDKVLSRYTYRIIAVSETVASFTAKQEGIAPALFEVIHNGIDIVAIERANAEAEKAALRREFGFLPDEKILISVARMVPQKNHGLLLDGFALFSKEHPEYRLLLVGAGSDYEELRRYVAIFPHRKKVVFAGVRHDVPQLYSLADFFVSTSIIEGFGIAHLEALACGLPVLTTKTAGPDRMIVEGKNGFFIHTETPEALAEDLSNMAKISVGSLRAAAKKSAQAFDIQRMVAKYEELFVRAAAR